MEKLIKKRIKLEEQVDKAQKKAEDAKTHLDTLKTQLETTRTSIMQVSETLACLEKIQITKELHQHGLAKDKVWRDFCARYAAQVLALPYHVDGREDRLGLMNVYLHLTEQEIYKCVEFAAHWEMSAHQPRMDEVVHFKRGLKTSEDRQANTSFQKAFEQLQIQIPMLSTTRGLVVDKEVWRIYLTRRSHMQWKDNERCIFLHVLKSKCGDIPEDFVSVLMCMEQLTRKET